MSRYRSAFLVWGFVLAVAATGQAYDRRTPIVEAFERNKDAVVSITGKQLAERDDIFSWDWEEWFFFRHRPQARPFLGSGFIVNERGYIVTNAHVVRRALEIRVTTADDNQYQAELVAIDPSVDLAILKIEANHPLPAVKLARGELMIGETVLAIGSPFGYQHTLTDGIISALHRDLEIGELVFSHLIQISAPINPGNSGGPLLNINGEVIGINTAIRLAAEGIGFAIPVDQLRKNLPRMLSAKIETGRRIDFGADLGDLKLGEFPDSPLGKTFAGVRVRAVRPESAAAKAGLVVGDIVTAIGGKSVSSAIDLYLEILHSPPGATVSFDVWSRQDHRSGASEGNAPGQGHEVDLVLRQRPKPDGTILAEQFFGLKLATLTERLARRFRIGDDMGNLVVLSVEPDSPADQAGIAAGDVLLGLDNKKLRDLDDLGLKLEALTVGDRVKLMLNRIRQRGWIMDIRSYERILRVRTNRADTNSRDTRLVL